MKTSITVLVSDMETFVKAFVKTFFVDIKSVRLSEHGYIFVSVVGDPLALFQLGKWLGFFLYS